MEVRVSNGEAQVSLSCEMSLYIHPDENLKWYRGEEEISPGSGRYTIVYSDGTLIGQFGGDIPGPSRVSTLVISQPQMSDSDNYTCLIINTQHMQDIQLTVDHVGRWLLYLFLAPLTAEKVLVVTQKSMFTFIVCITCA